MSTAYDDRVTWHGLSLRFIRMLTRQAPQYVSALAAMQHSTVHEDLSDPPVGSYVWFANQPWGDVGLSLGDRKMLCIDERGAPAIRRIGSHHHKPAGWSWHIGPDPDGPL